MINHEIVEGLRLALSRGYTLERAMMSFYNAGYKKEDIEGSARELYAHPSHPLSNPHKKTPAELKKPIEKAKPLSAIKLAANISEAVEKTEKVEAKKIGQISTYEDKPKSKGKLVIILVIVLILLGLGITGIIFYNELMSFFSALF